jgi:CO/xanthine dehydrogenase FAD-binding subunit
MTMLPDFAYFQPLTVKDAVDALTDDAVVCAGGTDLLGCMRDGIITRVVLPPVSENLKSAYRKVRARRAWDFALAGAALALEMNECNHKKREYLCCNFRTSPLPSLLRIQAQNRRLSRELSMM